MKSSSSIQIAYQLQREKKSNYTVEKLDNTLTRINIINEKKVDTMCHLRRYFKDTSLM